MAAALARDQADLPAIAGLIAAFAAFVAVAVPAAHIQLAIITAVAFASDERRRKDMVVASAIKRVWFRQVGVGFFAGLQAFFVALAKHAGLTGFFAAFAAFKIQAEMARKFVSLRLL